MSESSVIQQILKRFHPRKKIRGKICYQQEVKVGDNRADIIYYQFGSATASSVEYIVAVEAKVKDWRHALRQAYRDKLFADQAYVALPQKFAPPAIRHIHEFREASVGLIVADEKGIFVHHQPNINKHHFPPYRLRVIQTLTNNIK